MRQAMKNRIPGCALALFMTIGFLLSMAGPVKAETGTFGNGAIYTLDNGILTVSGGSFTRNDFWGLRNAGLSGKTNTVKAVVFKGTRLSDTAEYLFFDNGKTEDAKLFPALESVDLTGLDTSGITVMNDMFYCYTTLKSVTLGGSFNAPNI